jgi:Zn-dependent protease with chaperone function
MMRWKADRGLEARMLLTMILLAVLYLAFLAVLVSQGVNNILIILFIGGFMLLQYYYSDKMILSTMGAKMVSESEAPELHQIVSRLCAIADLPMPKIAVVNSSMPNAFATGRNQKNAVVAVTTGIMQKLDHSELEAVLAHELTHVKNRDMMVMTIATFLSSMAQILVRSMPFMGSGGGRTRSRLRRQLHSGIRGLPGGVGLELHTDTSPLQIPGVCCRPWSCNHHRAALHPGECIDEDKRLSGAHRGSEKGGGARKRSVHSACLQPLFHHEPLLDSPHSGGQDRGSAED